MASYPSADHDVMGETDREQHTSSPGSVQHQQPTRDVSTHPSRSSRRKASSTGSEEIECQGKVGDLTISYEPKRFKSLLKFYERLSRFERDQVDRHLYRLKKAIPELVAHYRVLKDMHHWKEKGRLDELHLRLFSQMAVGAQGYNHRYQPHWFKDLKYSLEHLVTDLEMMGLSEYVQEDLKDLERFVFEDALDLKPLSEIGFSFGETGEIESTVNKRAKVTLELDKLMAMISKKGASKVLLEGIGRLDELWSSYIREVMEEGFLKEGSDHDNPGSREILKVILITGAAGFLIGHDVKVSNPATLATAVIALASLVETDRQ